MQYRGTSGISRVIQLAETNLHNLFTVLYSIVCLLRTFDNRCTHRESDQLCQIVQYIVTT